MLRTVYSAKERLKRIARASLLPDTSSSREFYIKLFASSSSIHRNKNVFLSIVPPKQTTDLQTCPLRDSISSLDLPLSFYCHILHRFNLFRYLLSSIRNSRLDPAYTWLEYDDVSRESKSGSLKTRKLAECRRRTEWVRFSLFSPCHIIKIIFLFGFKPMKYHSFVEILWKLRRRWKNIQWLQKVSADILVFQ